MLMLPFLQAIGFNVERKMGSRCANVVAVVIGNWVIALPISFFLVYVRKWSTRGEACLCVYTYPDLSQSMQQSMFVYFYLKYNDFPFNQYTSLENFRRVRTYRKMTLFEIFQ